MNHPEIIVAGNKYTIGATGPDSPDHWKGFGGRKWTIRFNDGTVLKTDDLILSYCFKQGSKPNTAKIYQGWDEDAKECGWQQCGDEQAFGTI